MVTETDEDLPAPAHTSSPRSASRPGRDAITARVIADALRMFGDRADAALIERCARDAVRALWTERTTIFEFIPVLALRKVRDTLRERERRAPAMPVAAGAAPPAWRGGRSAA